MTGTSSMRRRRAAARRACRAGDHYAVATDKDRVRPPEFDDAGGNLSHLFVRMRPGVPGVRVNLSMGQILYGEVAEARETLHPCRRLPDS